jgi:hypothetical protein
MPMTSRERVLTTIHHEQPDRVPLVIGVSNATGIKMKPYRGTTARLPGPRHRRGDRCGAAAVRADS